MSLGLGRGDRLLLFLDDTPTYPAALFGAICAGLVPLLINTLTPPDLLQFYLADSSTKVAICDAAFAARFNAEACRDTNLEAVVISNGEAAQSATVRFVSAAHWLARATPDLTPADTRREDMAFWMYSSGSTGRPKGIVHLQHDSYLPTFRTPAISSSLHKTMSASRCRRSFLPTASAIRSRFRLSREHPACCLQVSWRWDCVWRTTPMVRDCAVLAINGVDGLTTLKAFVVLNVGSTGSEETTLQLQDYVKGRLLPHKYPRIVTYVSELPKTGSGKIDRQSLLKSQ